MMKKTGLKKWWGQRQDIKDSLDSECRSFTKYVAHVSKFQLYDSSPELRQLLLDDVQSLLAGLIIMMPV